MAIPFVNSSNDYFKQNFNKLHLNWRIVDMYLITQQYVPEEIGVYKKAYFFFVNNPSLYDGATMTEDLHDVFNLDLDAMLHDYFYIHYNVAGSYKYTQIADKLFTEETLRKGKSSWNVGVRVVLLKLKSWLGFALFAKHIAKRIMSFDDKANFMEDVRILAK